MSSPTQPFGLLLSDDLIFTSRIVGTAQALGLTVKQVKDQAGLRALFDQQPATGIIVDLANPGLDIGVLMDRMRSVAVPPRVVAYGAHVDVATLKRAREAGCDLVLPRSKFVEELPRSLPAWLAAKREA